eukprot:444405-Pleurochrysis_carterae.AAC.1
MHAGDIEEDATPATSAVVAEPITVRATVPATSFKSDAPIIGADHASDAVGIASLVVDEQQPLTPSPTTTANALAAP